MTLPICAGYDLALAVSQNCANKTAAIVYHAGILPTAIEGSLTPVSDLIGCLLSTPLIGPLLARFVKPGDYSFRVELKQPVFDFVGDGQIRIRGEAEAIILVNGMPQANIAFDLALPVTVSLVSPGSRPIQPDEPQIQVDIAHPELTTRGTGLPPNLQWAVESVSDAAVTFFVDHVLHIPAFPAFFRDQGYGVILRSVEVTSEQLIVRTDLEWPGRAPIPIIPARALMTRVPFTLRSPHYQNILQPADASNATSAAVPVRSRTYRPAPPVIRPGDITWPIGGPDYDFALAISEKPIRDVLDEKFPINFSKVLPDPVKRVDFAIGASFQLMDSAVDKIELAASIHGENSSAAEIHCTGEAEFRIEVALVRAANAVKGRVAALGVDVKKAECASHGVGVNAGKLAHWLEDQSNLKNAIDDKLRERFGEPLIPLTFAIFQQTIPDSNLSVSVELSNVDVVQDELQVWITLNEATAPDWHWPSVPLPNPGSPSP